MDTSTKSPTQITSQHPSTPQAKSDRPTFQLNLPSLQWASGGVLFFLFAMLFVLIVIGVETKTIPLSGGILIYVGILGLQFVFSPIIMDWVLRQFGSLSWSGIESLPPTSQQFTQEICAKYQFPVPRVGMIDDLSPQAFTYGNTPSNARLVLSKGMLEILTEDELNAVIAHELGHIQHKDFIFMTIAQLVPIVLYSVYRLTAGGDGDKKDRGQLAVIGLAAYGLYLVSQYVVLFLSRIREYWADQFSMENIPDPNALGRALLKISTGYGVLRMNPPTPAELDLAKKQKKKRGSMKQNPVFAFNIAGINDVKGWAGSLGDTTGGFEPENDGVKRLMRYDLWNPWAGIFELNSTHPVMGKRLVAVGQESFKKKIPSPFIFNFIKPNKVSFHLVEEVLTYFMPEIVGVVALILTTFFRIRSGHGSEASIFGFAIGVGVIAYALTSIIRILFIYPGGAAGKIGVLPLIERVTISPLNPLKVSVAGKIIGRGFAGDKLGSDLYLQDESGMIFVAVRSIVPLYDLYFGLAKAQSYIGQDVVIEGWFRRQPVPYLEVSRIQSGNNFETFRTRDWKIISWVVVALLAGFLIR